MNTFLAIKWEEDQIKKLDEHKNYKVVFFGSSNGFISAERRLSKIIKIDYLCDNDKFKKGSAVIGYKIFNPEEIFLKNKRDKFLVIVSSMYFEEILLQLSKYKNIENIISYRVLPNLTYSLVRDIVNQNNILQKNIIQNEISVFIDYIEPIKSEYLSFSSYCNEIISKNNHPDKLTVVDCKYNLNTELFTKLLEYYIFDRLEYENKPIIIELPYNLNDKLFLDVISNVLEKFDQKKFKLVEKTQKFVKKREQALIIHLYYIEMLETIYDEVKEIKDIFDIYISTIIDIKIEEIQRIKILFPNANIFIFENRGRDVLPFLKILNKIYDLGYETLCKVHTKKSLDRNKNGIEWGQKLRIELFNNSEMIINKLSNNEINFYADEKSCKSFKEPFFYFTKIKELAKYLNLEFHNDFIVPIGTMFWCKTNRLYPLINLKDYKYFSIEASYLDNQLEHAVEQIIGLLFGRIPESKYYKIASRIDDGIENKL